MIVAIIVSMVVLIMAVLAISVATSDVRQTANDRNRTTAVHAAEAGVDVAYRAIETAASSPTLPCSLNGTLSTDPIAYRYDVQITYYATYPATPTPMACPVATAPAAAQIVSTGTAVAGAYGTRKVTSLVKLSAGAASGGSFPKAIFANGNFSTSGTLTVTGSPTARADVYTNGTFKCSNTMTIDGSLLGQSGITTSGTNCDINDDVWGNGTVSLAKDSHVGRDVISSTSSVTGDYIVGRDIRAGTTISGKPTVGGAKYPNSPQGPPPAETFPTLAYSAGAWSSAGYNINTFTNDCNGAKTFLSGLAGTTTRQLVRASGCALSWSSAAYSTMSDLAIIADGFSATNTFTITNTDTVPHNLYIIVPAGTPCPAGEIKVTNNASFTNFNVFVYTPCDGTWTNKVVAGGQIYVGGVLTFSNAFSMNFAPSIVVPGFAGSGGAATGRKVDIIYKREG